MFLLALPTGAFYVSGSGITFYESATFTNNTSGLNGGKNDYWQRKVLA